jgi:hypothetical protein
MNLPDSRSVGINNVASGKQPEDGLASIVVGQFEAEVKPLIASCFFFGTAPYQ